MGRIREGSDAGRVKNVEHLEELCRLMADPNCSVKQLNTLYSIRTAWAGRGYLLDRELMIVRTDSSGVYNSKAAQRAASRESRMIQETLLSDDKVTIEPEVSVSSDVTDKSQDKKQLDKLGRKSK